MRPVAPTDDGLTCWESCPREPARPRRCHRLHPHPYPDVSPSPLRRPQRPWILRPLPWSPSSWERKAHVVHGAHVEQVVLSAAQGQKALFCLHVWRVSTPIEGWSRPYQQLRRQKKNSTARKQARAALKPRPWLPLSCLVPRALSNNGDVTGCRRRLLKNHTRLYPFLGGGGTSSVVLLHLIFQKLPRPRVD